jgi:hypothetical protein
MAARVAAMNLNVYEVRHDGHGLSIVVTESEERAARMVAAAMAVRGRRTSGDIRVVCRLAVDEECCYLLDDGDY